MFPNGESGFVRLETLLASALSIKRLPAQTARCSSAGCAFVSSGVRPPGSNSAQTINRFQVLVTMDYGQDWHFSDKVLRPGFGDSILEADGPVLLPRLSVHHLPVNACATFARRGRPFGADRNTTSSLATRRERSFRDQERFYRKRLCIQFSTITGES
jgi:hypothetical protein